MINSVEKTLRLSASPERVWRAITDPAELGRWFPEEAELTPSVGASGWFSWAAYGRFAVRIEELDAPRRLVWSWAREPGVALEDGARTTVEWTLEPAEGGGTILHLRESGFTDPEHRSGNDEGWDKELGELVEHLEGRTVAGGPER